MLKDIAEIIKESKRIMITTHINPDGDGIEAGLALMLALNKINSDKEMTVRFAIDDSIPSYIEYIDASCLIEKTEFVKSKYDFDLLISVDAASEARIGNSIKFLSENTKFINIDHHVSNTKFAQINYIDTSAASSAEIIYSLITIMGIEIDKIIGEPIYAGIINDTGNFSHNNVTESNFLIAANLRKIGVDTEKATKNMFYTKKISALKITGEVLSTMIFDTETKLSIGIATKEMLKKCQADKSDTEGIVDILRSLDTAETALFLREDAPGIFKGSLRSNGPDVNKIAGIFGGGGHIRAAGFTTEKSSTEIITVIKNALQSN